jgi:hypothetical protein
VKGCPCSCRLLHVGLGPFLPPTPLLEIAPTQLLLLSASMGCGMCVKNYMQGWLLP